MRWLVLANATMQAHKRQHCSTDHIVVLAATSLSSSLQGPRRRRGSMHHRARFVTSVLTLSCLRAAAPPTIRGTTHMPAHSQIRRRLHPIRTTTAHTAITPHACHNMVHYKHRTLAPYLPDTTARKSFNITAPKLTEARRTISKHTVHAHNSTYKFTANTQNLTPAHASRTQSAPCGPLGCKFRRSHQLHSPMCPNIGEHMLRRYAHTCAKTQYLYTPTQATTNHHFHR